MLKKSETETVGKVKKQKPLPLGMTLTHPPTHPQQNANQVNCPKTEAGAFFLVEMKRCAAKVIMVTTITRINQEMVIGQ